MCFPVSLWTSQLSQSFSEFLVYNGESSNDIPKDDNLITHVKHQEDSFCLALDAWTQAFTHPDNTIQETAEDTYQVED